MIDGKSSKGRADKPCFPILCGHRTFSISHPVLRIVWYAIEYTLGITEDELFFILLQASQRVEVCTLLNKIGQEIRIKQRDKEDSVSKETIPKQMWQLCDVHSKPRAESACEMNWEPGGLWWWLVTFTGIVLLWHDKGFRLLLSDTLVRQFPVSALPKLQWPVVYLDTSLNKEVMVFYRYI